MRCPICNSQKIKKNGYIHNGKQGYRSPVSRRDFVTHTGRPIPKSDSRQRDASKLPRHVRSQYGNCVLRYYALR